MIEITQITQTTQINDDTGLVSGVYIINVYSLVSIF
jgi:hypothetical protein